LSAIKKGEEAFNQGAKWLVGKNSLLSFWFDKWLDKGTMKSLIQGPLKWEEESLLLRDVITPFGCNWESIFFVIPKSLSLVIKAIPLPLTNEGADRLSWSSSSSGSF